LNGTETRSGLGTIIVPETKTTELRIIIVIKAHGCDIISAI
jgi:hypothetical protein